MKDGEDMEFFMGENFLLKNEIVVSFYYYYVKDMLIIDYYCYLSLKEIYENKIF